MRVGGLRMAFHSKTSNLLQVCYSVKTQPWDESAQSGPHSDAEGVTIEAEDPLHERN